LIHFVDRAFLHHVIDHVAAHRVDEVVLSSAYPSPGFDAFTVERRVTAGEHPRITWIEEPAPLGTGGAVAAAVREAGLSEAFFVLNGDTLTDLDLTALWALHRERDAIATIALTDVSDARPFGSVSLLDDRIVRFLEKATDPVEGLINAGAYVLEPAALEGLVDGTVSIEREVFPSLIASGAPLFGFRSDAYWMDIGTPEGYLRATFDALNGMVSHLSYRTPFVADDADVSPAARLGRSVAVGSRSRVEDGAVVRDSALLPGSIVEAGANVAGCIIGPKARIRRDAWVRDAVLAEGSEVSAGVRTVAARLGPGRILEHTGAVVSTCP
jgi:mannose-1-phosphate guanylyltransferase